MMYDKVWLVYQENYVPIEFSVIGVFSSKERAFEGMNKFMRKNGLDKKKFSSEIMNDGRYVLFLKDNGCYRIHIRNVPVNGDLK